MKIPEFALLVDDTNIEKFGMKLVEYETSSYVDRKVSGVDIPGAHGTKAVPSALASSEFRATVVCTGRDADEVQSRIRQFFAFMYSTQDAHKIVFTDDLNVIRYAILQMPERHKVTTGIDGAMAQIKLIFLMLDPFAYQNEPDKLTTIAGHGEQTILTNEAFECPAIFTFRNTGTSDITDVSLIVNDELTVFTCTLSPGDELVLDTVEYEVRFNGQVRLDYWAGEMPMLKNGDNIIYQQNSQHSEILLSVEFTKQWV